MKRFVKHTYVSTVLCVSSLVSSDQTQSMCEPNTMALYPSRIGDQRYSPSGQSTHCLQPLVRINPLFDYSDLDSCRVIAEQTALLALEERVCCQAMEQQNCEMRTIIDHLHGEKNVFCRRLNNAFYHIDRLNHTIDALKKRGSEKELSLERWIQAEQERTTERDEALQKLVELETTKDLLQQEKNGKLRAKKAIIKELIQERDSAVNTLALLEAAHKATVRQAREQGISRPAVRSPYNAMIANRKPKCSIMPAVSTKQINARSAAQMITTAAAITLSGESKESTIVETSSAQKNAPITPTIKATAPTDSLQSKTATTEQKTPACVPPRANVAPIVQTIATATDKPDQKRRKSQRRSNRKR